MAFPAVLEVYYKVSMLTPVKTYFGKSPTVVEYSFSSIKPDSDDVNRKLFLTRTLAMSQSRPFETTIGFVKLHYKTIWVGSHSLMYKSY